MKVIHTLVFCAIVLILMPSSAQAQSTTEGVTALPSDNLNAFVTRSASLYTAYVMSLPYDVPDNLFRGGNVASNYIVPINDTQLMFSANWNRNPEILLSEALSIQIRFQNFFEYTLQGSYKLEGLENSQPVYGNGNFAMNSNLTELSFFFFYDTDETNHLNVFTAYSYYSNYLPTSFSFSGKNGTDPAYEKSIATAITEFSMRNALIIYHQQTFKEYLQCVFDLITLTEIENGGTVDSYNCLSDIVSIPTGDPTAGPSVSTTEITESTTFASSTTPTITTTQTTTTTPKTTTQITTTTTPRPDLNFTCLGRPDGYYQHPSNCSKFLGCLNGALREFSCPTFLVFYPERQTCVHPNQYTCPFESFSCNGKVDGYYASLVDCAKYFGCLNGELFKEFTCPYDYLFEETSQRCIPMSQSECWQRFEVFEETHKASHFIE